MHALERHPWLRGGLIAFALGLLTAWLIYTPPGLLGKADAIGYAVCHRSPAHSFFVGEIQLPLCARCSGTFLGALIGLMVQLPRGRRAGWPPFPLQWAVILLGLAFALDGVNSFLSLLPGATALYPPNNALRLASGSGFGAALAILLYPFINQILWAQPIPEAALATPWQGLSLFAAVAAGALGIYARLPWLTLPLAFLSTVGVIILLSLCYTLLWVVLLQRENTFTTWRGLGGFLLVGLTTALLQIVLVDAGRFFLTGTWAGFMLP